MSNEPQTKHEEIKVSIERKLSFIENLFEVLTHKITLVLGHPLTFIGALIVVLIWMGIDIFQATSLHTFINDVVFSFTFLMVFILQKAQNKFSTVMNLKLNELVASHENASNRLIKVEDLTEKELRKLAGHYETLSANLGKTNEVATSASIEHVIEELKIEELKLEEQEKKNEAGNFEL